MRKFILFLSLIVVSSQPSLAHPGGLDKSGCHTNRKTSEYHCHNSPAKPTQSSQADIEKRVIPCTITKVVDGDTFHCDLSATEKAEIRLIGIDTPESSRNAKAKKDAERSGQDLDEIVAFGKQAKEFAGSHLPKGTTVKLELDAQEKDKYGRTLAYAYLPNGVMFNSILLKEGYAQVLTYPPNVRYQEKFLELQREARENKRGLWRE